MLNSGSVQKYMQRLIVAAVLTERLGRWHTNIGQHLFPRHGAHFLILMLTDFCEIDGNISLTKM